MKGISRWIKSEISIEKTIKYYIEFAMLTKNIFKWLAKRILDGF